MKTCPTKSPLKHHRRCRPLPSPPPAVFFQHEITRYNHHDGMGNDEHDESFEVQTIQDDLIVYLASLDIQTAIENMTKTSLPNLMDYKQLDMIMKDDGQNSVSASLQTHHNSRTSSTESSTTIPRSPSTSSASSCRSIGSFQRSYSWGGCGSNSRHGQITNDFCWQATGVSQLGFQMAKSPTSVLVHGASSSYGGHRYAMTTTASHSPVAENRLQKKKSETLETQPKEHSGKQEKTEISKHRNSGTTCTTTGGRSADLLVGKLDNARRRMYGKIKLRGAARK